MREAIQLSDGGLRMGPATLYTSIQRLLDQSLVEETDSPEGADSRRRYYQLTPAGRNALETELARMESALKKARGLRIGKAEALP